MAPATESSQPREAVLFAGRGSRAALAALLHDAPTVISSWLCIEGRPSALPDDVLERVTQIAGALSDATEALVLHWVDVAAGVQRVVSIVHDGRQAVYAGGDEGDAAAISVPIALGEVIAQIAERIGGRVDDDAPHTIELDRAVLITLRAVLGPAPATTRTQTLTRLADVAAALGSRAEPEQLLEALEDDGLVAFADDGALRPGSRFADEPALVGAASGGDLVITRMSIARSPGPAAYDVRTLEFAGTEGERCLVTSADDRSVRFARISIEELMLVLTSHAAARSEPAQLAAGSGTSMIGPVPAEGQVCAISSAGLLDPEATDEMGGLAGALLTPPAVIALRREGWDIGRAEGVAVWPQIAVGWSWSWGGGYARVGARAALADVVTEMLDEHLNQPELGPLELNASSRSRGSLTVAAITLGCAGAHGWTVTSSDGVDDSTPPESAALARAMVTAVAAVPPEPA